MVLDMALAGYIFSKGFSKLVQHILLGVLKWFKESIVKLHDSCTVIEDCESFIDTVL